MPSQPTWRKIQRNNFTDWKSLLSFLELESFQSILTQPRFPLNLPKRLAEKIEKGNPNDPILLQFLPTVKELERDPLFLQDPVGDGKSAKTSKLLHKYHGRALLVTTGACAMNCRFCFRQHYDYEREDKTFDAEIETIAADNSLTEILLSGGDPLSLSDEVLGSLIGRLSAIPHLKRLRFHTRFPIGIPERIDASFLSLLESTRLQVFFIIHSNHARELDDAVLAALKSIQKLGCQVLCQSVLLKGVNDNLDALRALCEKLVDAGIIPYYLHQLDRVEGAKHFEVPMEKGIALIEELRLYLPGYGVPAFVAEIAGGTEQDVFTLTIVVQKKAGRRTSTMKRSKLKLKKDTGIRLSNPMEELLNEELIGKAIRECLQHGDAEGAIEVIRVYLEAVNKTQTTEWLHPIKCL